MELWITFQHLVNILKDQARRRRKNFTVFKLWDEICQYSTLKIFKSIIYNYSQYREEDWILSQINDRIKDSPSGWPKFVSASQNVRQKFRLAIASRILSRLAEITSLCASRTKIWQKFSVRASKISGTVSTSSQFFHSHASRAKLWVKRSCKMTKIL